MISVTFRYNGHNVVAHPGESTLEAILRAKLRINHSCGGHGTCGTCCVKVERPLNFDSPRTEIEAELAEDRSWSPQHRMACQLSPQPGLELCQKVASVDIE